jgi:hypothetical protein
MDDGRMLTGGQQPWWNQLSDAVRGVAVEGLVFVKTYRRDGRPPEEVVLMEKAREYGAQAVFFEAAMANARCRRPSCLSQTVLSEIMSLRRFTRSSGVGVAYP